MSIEDSSVTNGTRHSPEVTIQVTTAGEVNTGQNVGTGAEVFKDKDAAYLNFRTLDAGSGISIVEGTDSIVFEATGVTDAIDALTTADIDEDPANLYYTNDRVWAAISASGVLSFNDTTGEITFTGTQYSSADFDTDFAAKSTDDLAQGPTNKYYTDALARAAISGTGDVSYNATSGEISVTTYKTADFTTDFAAATAGKNLLENWAEDNDGNLLPVQHISFDLGSTSNKIRAIYAEELHISPNTIYIGPDSISVTGDSELTINGDIVATENYVNATLGDYVQDTALQDYSTTTQMNSALSLKANTADVYNKTSADLLLDAKADAADVYTTTQTDALLGGKADAATTYTKTEVDGAITAAQPTGYNNAAWDLAHTWGDHSTEGYLVAANLTPYSTTAQMNTALDLKANAATTYNKTEVDGLVSAATPVNYNNTNWDTAHGWGDHSAAGYLTAHQDITGKLDVTLFNTTIANYSTTAQMNAAITASAPVGYNNSNWDTAFGWGNHSSAGYLVAADITGKADTATVNSALALKANAADVYTTTQADSLLDAKADEVNVYSKTEVDAIIGTSGAGHNHDDLYYTETEIDTLIADYSTTAQMNTAITAGAANGNVAFGWGDHSAAGYLTSVAPETITSLSLAANILKYTDEDGVETDLDLSIYIDDTNLARLISATLDPVTNIATFTRDDTTTFTVDLSNLAQDLSPYSTTTDMNTAIGVAVNDMATQTWVNSQAYLTAHQDITGKADTTYVDAQDALKADAATTYTKTEVDGMIGTAGSGHNHDDLYYTESEIDAALALKANTADVYTQAQANTLLDAKANAVDVYSKTDADARYIQTETDPIFGASPAATISSAGITNWEEAYNWGDHSVEGYLVAADISGKADTTYVDAQDALKADITYVDAADALKANAADVYTQTAADALLADKANSVDVYTKTESDAIIADYSTTTQMNTAIGTATANSADWDTAFGWGNHGVQGYLVPADISGKADAVNVYTKTESDAIIANYSTTTQTNAYADQAEVDAKAYTDARETAITTAYQSYADAAESAAISAAAIDATTKANAAQAAAEANIADVYTKTEANNKFIEDPLSDYAFTAEYIHTGNDGNYITFDNAVARNLTTFRWTGLSSEYTGLKTTPASSGWMILAYNSNGNKIGSVAIASDNGASSFRSGQTHPSSHAVQLNNMGIATTYIAAGPDAYGFQLDADSGITFDIHDSASDNDYWLRNNQYRGNPNPGFDSDGNITITNPENGIYKILLESNATLSNLSYYDNTVTEFGFTDGNEFTLILQQPATGGSIVTLPSDWIIPNGYPTTNSIGPNIIDKLRIYKTGGVVYAEYTNGISYATINDVNAQISTALSNITLDGGAY